MTAAKVQAQAIGPPRAWYREVTHDQWMAFVGAYSGWVLDGFDFTILTFLLVDIQRSFAVNATLAGLLGQVTLMFRLVGGIGAGTAADRWGRKGPLMFSILWYSAFAFLSGFSTSFGMLFACRALFGIGMGGVWAAGMPLTLEHWPAHLRGRASGMLQSGHSLGLLLSAPAFQFVHPLLKTRPDLGWRAMVLIRAWRALLVLLTMKDDEARTCRRPRRRHRRDAPRRGGDPDVRLRVGRHGAGRRRTRHGILRRRQFRRGSRVPDRALPHDRARRRRRLRLPRRRRSWLVHADAGWPS